MQAWRQICVNLNGNNFIGNSGRHLQFSIFLYRLQTSAKGIQITQGQSSLALPPMLFSQSNSSVTVVSVFFSTLGQILTSSEALNISYSSGSDWLINSQLASVTVRPSPPDVIQPPFKLALETNKVTH